MDQRDLRTLRLFDLRPDQSIFIRCPCGRVSQFLHGVLQKLHKIPSDTLVYDLQFRGKCEKCGRWQGLGVTIEGARTSGGIPTECLVVVRMEGEKDGD